MFDSDPNTERRSSLEDDDDTAAAKFLAATETCRDQCDFDRMWDPLQPGARAIVRRVHLRLATARYGRRLLQDSGDA